MNKPLNQNRMKQTAVEWLAKEIQEQLNMFFPNATLYQPTIEKAKEMEKEKRIKAHKLGYDTGYKVCEMKFNGLFKSE